MITVQEYVCHLCQKYVVSDNVHVKHMDNWKFTSIMPKVGSGTPASMRHFGYCIDFIRPKDVFRSTRIWKNSSPFGSICNGSKVGLGESWIRHSLMK